MEKEIKFVSLKSKFNMIKKKKNTTVKDQKQGSHKHNSIGLS